MYKLIILSVLSIILTGCATYTDLFYTGNPGNKPATAGEHVRFFFDDIVESASLTDFSVKD